MRVNASGVAGLAGEYAEKIELDPRNNMACSTTPEVSDVMKTLKCAITMMMRSDVAKMWRTQ